MKSLLQRYNPTATAGCFAGDYIACKGGRGSGGQCRRNNVTYEIECGLCQGDEKSVYVGETARNLFTRGGSILASMRWGKKPHSSSNINNKNMKEDLQFIPQTRLDSLKTVCQGKWLRGSTLEDVILI